MSLILDNCAAATEDQVRAVACPAPQGRWCPISHGDAIDFTLAGIERAGLKVDTTAFALSGPKKSSGNTRLFGEITIKGGQGLAKDFSMAIGIRNSIDKTISYNICGGERVFVCGNMCFSGEFIERRKHTTNIEGQLSNLIDGALANYTNGFKDRVSLIEHWKSLEVDPQLADHIIMTCMRTGAIPAAQIPKVLHEWEEPRHPEFQDRTVWSMMNAFTQAHKTRNLDPNMNADSSIAVNDTFAALFPLETACAN